MNRTILLVLRVKFRETLEMAWSSDYCISLYPKSYFKNASVLDTTLFLCFDREAPFRFAPDFLSVLLYVYIPVQRYASYIPSSIAQSEL